MCDMKLIKNNCSEVDITYRAHLQHVYCEKYYKMNE